MRAVFDYALAHSVSLGMAFAAGLFIGQLLGLGAFIWLDAYASFGRVRR
jgi:hypothetical protein